MPIWLVSALALIAPLVARLGGRIIGARGLALTGAAGAAGLEAAGVIDIIPGLGRPGGIGAGLFGGGGGDGRPVRRRKKALTNTDMATMALIASTVSKKAAENFILMRVRR